MRTSESYSFYPWGVGASMSCFGFVTERFSLLNDERQTGTCKTDPRRRDALVFDAGRDAGPSLLLLLILFLIIILFFIFLFCE